MSPMPPPPSDAKRRLGVAIGLLIGIAISAAMGYLGYRIFF